MYRAVHGTRPVSRRLDCVCQKEQLTPMSHQLCGGIVPGGIVRLGRPAHLTHAVHGTSCSQFCEFHILNIISHMSQKLLPV